MVALHASRSGSRDRVLYVFISLALVFSLGHHVDHLIRGNHVGWPVTSEVNAFTYSLGIYPAILTGLVLYRLRLVGPGLWIFLSSGGGLFLAAIHFGPWAVEPQEDIIGLYESRIMGWLAFGWLVALIGVLIAASVYEVRLWLRERGAAADRPT